MNHGSFYEVQYANRTLQVILIYFDRITLRGTRGTLKRRKKRDLELWERMSTGPVDTLLFKINPF